MAPEIALPQTVCEWCNGVGFVEVTDFTGSTFVHCVCVES